MTLAVKALMNRLRMAVEQAGLVSFRVAYKANAKGEHVVAIIWKDEGPELSDREVKRRVRAMRS